MAGTTGLEPAASAVTGHAYLAFQRLTRIAGVAKSLEGISRTQELWVELWVRKCLESMPRPRYIFRAPQHAFVVAGAEHADLVTPAQKPLHEISPAGGAT